MKFECPTSSAVERLIALAMEEDLGPGDVTTEALVPDDLVADARIVARADACLCGLPLCRMIFTAYDGAIECVFHFEEGDDVRDGDAVMSMHGPADRILSAERVALNFLQRLSGVATLTRAYVRAVEGTNALILDTRKTTPGMREMEKYAVLCGGGTNHRMGLYDRVMIKDNHRLVWLEQEHMHLADAVESARVSNPEMLIEIEVDSLDEYRAVLPSEPDWILLDNMTCEQMAECVRMPHAPTRLEASGGVTLDTVRAIAETGVDAISVGALTHSAPAVDFSLEFTTQ